MSAAIAPQKTVTFTVISVPKRAAELKTIQRLMRMQPDIQHALKKLARRRRLHDNKITSHAGRDWVQRVRATKLTYVRPGETFTLTVTPQIIPDIKSVERYLKAKAARHQEGNRH
ncbi:MAG: hypothetical protein ACYS0G_14565 [Planctomycetota bacterium]|jgi:hypothetical protein